MTQNIHLYPVSKMVPMKRTRNPRSLVSRLMSVLRRGGDVRAAKVRRLRADVRASRYENELKLDVAVERLMREL